MDFIEKLGDTIAGKGKEVAGKAKNTAEIFNLKNQISTCEEVVKKNFQEIGRIYYETYGASPEEPFAAPCEAVRNAYIGINNLQDKINELKG